MSDEHERAMDATFSPTVVVKPLVVSHGPGEEAPQALESAQEHEIDSTSASIALANHILREAGWTPIPKPCWNGGYTMARQVGGVAPDGTQYVKGLDIVLPGDPGYGPDTPDEHHEAAAWLVEHAKARAPVSLSSEATLEPVRAVIMEQPDETPVSASEAEAGPAETVADALDSGAETDPDERAGGVGETDDGSSSGGLAIHDELGREEPGYCDPEDVLDADFEEAGEQEELGAELAEDYPALTDEQIEILREQAPQDDPQPSGGVVYFGDDIHIARLAKMGRLLEIATEKKAGLQEGWTVQEFASLQNLIMRINRGEAPDDQNARERFDHISAYSRAMNTVDAYLAKREAELEEFAKGLRWDATSEEREAARAAILAFNPEEWP